MPSFRTIDCMVPTGASSYRRLNCVGKMTQDFDPVAFKETTRQQWQNAAAAWHRWTPTLQAWLGPVTEVMLDMARLQPGSRVLDLAAGAGEPSLVAGAKGGSAG